jgi:SAM-dependent methyltransferase
VSSPEWADPEHVRAYLAVAGRVPHRAEGEAALLEHVPAGARRVLDLGTGDGHLLALVAAARAGVGGVGLDFSPAMLAAARERFAGAPWATVVEHDLGRPLPDLGRFDAVVSSFAIHHLAHERKRALYAETWAVLRPGGAFCNLEHVASPTPRLHAEFLALIGGGEDASNRLLDVESQLGWLREIGFEDVDVHWKWRELALLAGRRPLTAPQPSPTPGSSTWTAGPGSDTLPRGS